MGVKGRGEVAPSGGGIGGLYTKILHMEYNRDLAAKNPSFGRGECEMVMLRGWVEDNISVLGRVS